MTKLLFACTLVAFVAAQNPTTTTTTQAPHHNHHPHEHHVHESFNFFLDIPDDKMIIKTKKACYAFDLIGAQRTDVHIPIELRFLEIKFLALIANGTQTLLKHSELSHNAAAQCHRHKIFAIAQI